jgi:hypothetical protein
MTPSSRRKLGLTLIVVPPVLVVATIVLFPIFNIIFQTLIFSSETGGGGVVLIARVVNIVLGFLGFIGMAGLFTAFPIGLYLFFSTPKTPGVPQAPTPPPQV